ncbi:MAG TPA: alanine racemase [Thermoanaerobaculia bacterium]|jgi:alanine racemase
MTRAVIDLDAIARNYRALRDRVSPRAVFAVVKADAYGHGAAAVARRLEREGADRFAVANTDEGVALRRAGVVGEVLLLSCAEPEDLPRQRAYGLTPTLYDVAQAEAVVAAAERFPGGLRVHVELDTGMGRAGIRPEELDRILDLFRRGRRAQIAGTFATLSSADDPCSPETARQLEILRGCVARMREAGVAPGLVHLANSAAVLAHRETWLDAVRPGLALYGVPPSGLAAAPELTPAMTVETRVVGARRVPEGTPLGYGGRFVTARPTTVAVLPIGYHDGFRRSFSGTVPVLLRGRKAPVVGSISMDVTLVDATETGAERGDRVTCLGRDGDAAVSAWDLARAAGTIPYEILCGFGPRVRRAYTGEGGA